MSKREISVCLDRQRDKHVDASCRNGESVVNIFIGFNYIHDLHLFAVNN